jgi:hypothetical protein
MANPLRGHIKRRNGCTSHGIFRSGNYSMVVRDGHRCALRTKLQSRHLSFKRRSDIGRRAIRDPEWNHHRSIDWPSYCHLGDQSDLTTR